MSVLRFVATLLWPMSTLLADYTAALGTVGKWVNFDTETYVKLDIEA